MKFNKIILFVGLFICRSLIAYGGESRDDCFVVYADTRGASIIHKQIVREIKKLNPTAIFHAGDLVNDGGNKDEWAIFNVITAELRKTTPYYPALGNHEKESRLFFSNFNLAKGWYSLEISGICFIILDTNIDFEVGSPQYKWLESDLRNINHNIKFIVAIFHHPPFSCVRFDKVQAKVRDILVPLFSRYKVAVVFSGHNHGYERSKYKDTYYVVSAGGGASLYRAKLKNPYSQVFLSKYNFCRICRINDQLVVDALSCDLKLLDEFTVEAKKF